MSGKAITQEQVKLFMKQRAEGTGQERSCSILPPRCTERPNATVQRAVAGMVMRSASVGSGRVNEKK